MFKARICNHIPQSLGNSRTQFSALKSHCHLLKNYAAVYACSFTARMAQTSLGQTASVTMLDCITHKNYNMKKPIPLKRNVRKNELVMTNSQSCATLAQ